MSLHLVINQKTTGNDEVINFFRSPNTECTQYNLLVFTPSLNTGVSIDVPHFDKVYLLQNPGSCTPKGAVQGIGRVRKIRCNEVVICYPETFPEQKPDDIEFIYNSLLNSKIEELLRESKYDCGFSRYLDQEIQGDAKKRLAILNFAGLLERPELVRTENEYGETVIQQKPKPVILTPQQIFFLDIYCMAIAERNRENNEYSHTLLTSLAFEGYALQYYVMPKEENQEEITQKTKEVLAIKRSIKQLDAQEILSAPTIDPMALKKLQKKARKTSIEHATLAKAQIINYYGDCTEKTIAIWDNGKHPLAMDKLAIALGNRDILQSEIRFQDKTLFAKRNSPLTLQITFLRVCQGIGLDTHTLEFVGNPYTFPINKRGKTSKKRTFGANDTSIIELQQWLLDKYPMLISSIFTQKIQTIQNNHVRAISSILLKFGLKLQRVGKNALLRYTIDKKSLAIAKDVLTRQGIMVNGAVNPLFSNDKKAVPI